MPKIIKKHENCQKNDIFSVFGSQITILEGFLAKTGLPAHFWSKISSGIGSKVAKINKNVSFLTFLSKNQQKSTKMSFFWHFVRNFMFLEVSSYLRNINHKIKNPITWSVKILLENFKQTHTALVRFQFFFEIMNFFQNSFQNYINQRFIHALLRWTMC
jgi:hypothetical protein